MSTYIISTGESCILIDFGANLLGTNRAFAPYYDRVKVLRDGIRLMV